MLPRGFLFDLFFPPPRIKAKPLKKPTCELTGYKVPAILRIQVVWAQEVSQCGPGLLGSHFLPLPVG